MKSNNNDNLSVAVVVPVYNRDKLIERCLDSIFSQDHSPIHLIVVDNNSTDNSRETIERWARNHSRPGFSFTLSSESTPGAAVTRHNGSRLASEDLLMFMDSDDAMKPGLISRAVKEFLANPTLDIVSWPVTIHDLDGTSRKTHTWQPANREEFHLVHGVYRTYGYIMTTRFYNRIGGWSKNLPVWNDWELGVRICLNYPNEATLTSPKVDVYAQPQSITGTDFHSKAGKWEATIDEVEKMISASAHNKRQKMLKLVDYRRIILAAHYRREGEAELARHLLRETLSDPGLSLKDRLILRFAYSYTRRGLRGAYRLIAPII